MEREFKAFSKIERLNKARMVVTQKIHGTNAQVAILPNEAGEFELLTGSRTRWIYPGDDNYGFAAFVHANKAEFIEKLGPGIHYGEWAGPGINSGEGLTEKTFVLFDFWRYLDKPLPPGCRMVPVLYDGPMNLATLDDVMKSLKETGSYLVPGFMRPEGVVVQTLGTRYKKVFEAEETQWTGVPKDKGPKEPRIDYSHLLQPIRLEKLLSRDEAYVRDFPKSLPDIVRAYIADLLAEDQISGTPDEVKAIRKGASSDIFAFVRTYIDEVCEVGSQWDREVLGQ